MERLALIIVIVLIAFLSLLVWLYPIQINLDRIEYDENGKAVYVIELVIGNNIKMYDVSISNFILKRIQWKEVIKWEMMY